MVAVGDDEDEGGDGDKGDDGDTPPPSDGGEREYTGTTAGDDMRGRRGDESMDECRWTRLGLFLIVAAVS